MDFGVPTAYESSPSESRSERKSEKRQKDQKPKQPWVFAFLRFLLPVAFGFIAVLLLYRSFDLYQTAFERLGFGGNLANVCFAFQPLPLLGGWLSDGCRWLYDIAIALVAFVVLLLLTTLQSVPTLLYFHGDSIRRMVGNLRRKNGKHPRLEHESSDTEEVTRLVDRHNALPSTALRTLLVASVVAFFVEGLLVWIARSGNSDIWTIAIDSLGFDLLLAGYLILSNVFASRAVPDREYGQ